MYFDRKIEKRLLDWKESSSRKPLLIRGARQVGKSCTVRQFAKANYDQLVECNFEKYPQLKSIFQKDLDPKRILCELELFSKTRIEIGRTLLFFDEIQECPLALKGLRYFFEELPDLHLIAAGSLLEFIIGKVSWPVGRIEQSYLYPMSFSEFLEATGRQQLSCEIPQLKSANSSFMEAAMRFLYEALHEYMIVGGMPEAVLEYVSHRSYARVAEVQDAIIKTFRDDVHKYSHGELQLSNLEQTMARVFRYTGDQIKYSTLHPDDNYKRTKRSLEVLERALLIHAIPSIHPSGLPLGAEASSKHFKCIFLDIGLGQRMAGLDPREILTGPDVLATYQGRLAEQFVGQQLLSESRVACEDRRLFCWIRTSKSSTAEVDYVIVREGEIIPVEVKAGKSGRLKSLQIFMRDFPRTERAICLQHRHDYHREGKVEFWPLFTCL